MSDENKEDKLESRFKCACCGKAVIVHEEKIFRICGHDDAAVTADCSAVCYGESNLAQ